MTLILLHISLITERVLLPQFVQRSSPEDKSTCDILFAATVVVLGAQSFLPNDATWRTEQREVGYEYEYARCPICEKNEFEVVTLVMVNVVRVIEWKKQEEVEKARERERESRMTG